MVEIRVPTLGESVTEATIGKWFKHPGDPVAADEPLVELETDKVTIEVPAPAAGVLADIAAKDGETVAVGALLGQINEGAPSASATVPASARRAEQKAAPREEPLKQSVTAGAAEALPVSQPAAGVALRAPAPPDDAAREERVKMTRLRQTIARRLKEAQNTAAM